MRRILGMTGNTTLVQDLETEETESLNLVVDELNNVQALTDDEFRELTGKEPKTGATARPA